MRARALAKRRRRVGSPFRAARGHQSSPSSSPDALVVVGRRLGRGGGRGRGRLRARIGGGPWFGRGLGGRGRCGARGRRTRPLRRVALAPRRPAVRLPATIVASLGAPAPCRSLAPLVRALGHHRAPQLDRRDCGRIVGAEEESHGAGCRQSGDEAGDNQRGHPTPEAGENALMVGAMRTGHAAGRLGCGGEPGMRLDVRAFSSDGARRTQRDSGVLRSAQRRARSSGGSARAGVRERGAVEIGAVRASAIPLAASRARAAARFCVSSEVVDRQRSGQTRPHGVEANGRGDPARSGVSPSRRSRVRPPVVGLR